MNQQTSISNGLNCKFGGGPPPVFLCPCFLAASFFLTLSLMSFHLFFTSSTSFVPHVMDSEFILYKKLLLFTQIYEILIYSKCDALLSLDAPEQGDPFIL